ncbi:DUF6186 family protein [Nonomuraea typhae]|uniref:DUF6186 family protein n=1 Tax=Nonomuraea typhae TaxID=2603600 RepID=UPI0012F79A2E|nr:DUF6186 family protein [Nonomuraea typhae]
MTTWALTVVVYGAALVAMLVLEIAARWPGSTLPTAGECLARVMRHPAGRLLVVLSWWWIGWHFLAR